MMKGAGGFLWFLLLVGNLGCSVSPNSKENFSQQKMENDSVMCERITDARMGGRGVPDWKRAYDECMVTGGQ